MGRHSTPRKRWVVGILLGLVGLLVITVAAVTIFLLNLGRDFDEATPNIPEPFPHETSRPYEDPDYATVHNILLLGSDTRGSLGDDLDGIRDQRSDTIMVVHIPRDRQHVYVMSIPRDSWVEIPGHGQAKINAALSLGGVPLVVETVESLLSARIDHVALVDFSGFRDITEALGGVTVDNEIAFSVGGFEFPEGEVELDRDSALPYVRERSSFEDGDFQRVRNQQAYIEGVLEKVLSAETLTNPGRMISLVESVGPHLTVDDGLTAGYLVGLGLEMQSLRADDVTFFTFPTTGIGTSADGQSIVVVDWDRVEELQEAFSTDSLGEYVGRDEEEGSTPAPTGTPASPTPTP